MSDVFLKLLLVDQDPIFRLGLHVALEQVPNLQVVSEAETYTAALQTLAEMAQKDSNQVNLVILELGNNFTADEHLGLKMCRHLKTEYPNLPILLLSSVREQRLLLAARATGVEGYCPKGTPISELVAVMRFVSVGISCWFGDSEIKEITPHSSQSPFAIIRNSLRMSESSYIDATLAEVTAQLKIPGLLLLDRAILAGRRRELLTARWLINRLLSSPYQRKRVIETQNLRSSKSYLEESAIASLQLPLSTNSKSDSSSTPNSPSLLNPKFLQAALFSSCVNKLQLNLQNVTNIPLEIDILRLDKKRELLYIILQKIVNILDEIRTSQVDYKRLYELKNTLLLDVLQAVNIDFFGKFSRVQVGERQLEVVTLLLQETEVVQRDILNKIPLVNELLSYLLFKTDLLVDNKLYQVGSIEAQEQALIILENLLIQVANAVIQPLLNRLADVETIKQNFYDQKLISTREIERFRNNLSWRYRIKNLILEPKAIFESCYQLFVFAPRGIATVSIYAPRSQELAQLSGIPLIITLALEFRDAIAPRIQSLLSLFGNGLVFILTQVIGRSLGLIGRGIIQGIGSFSLSDSKNKKL